MHHACKTRLYTHDVEQDRNPYGVAPGQIWADCKRMRRGRTIRVLEVVDTDEPYAICETISDYRDGRTAKIGRKSSILLSRFYPNFAGYRRVDK